jgi:thiol-disulfide isomerase/thioredoxin
MNDPAAAKPKGGILKWALWGVALFGVAAVVYIMAQASFKPAQDDGGLKDVTKGEMAKFSRPAEAGAAPATSFTGPDGKPIRVADFKGKVVVMNIWATWCAPCVLEMPTLAKLQANYAGQPVEVVAVSIDSATALDKARMFIAKNAPLKFYHDPNMKMPFAVTPQAPGMPTTIIYGPDGVERGRLAGGAEWSGPDAKALIDKIIAAG